MGTDSELLTKVKKLRDQYSVKEVLKAVLKVYSIPATVEGFSQAVSEYTEPYKANHPHRAVFSWLAENLTQISSHYLALRKPPEENEKGE